MAKRLSREQKQEKAVVAPATPAKSEPAKKDDKKEPAKK